MRNSVGTQQPRRTASRGARPQAPPRSYSCSTRRGWRGRGGVEGWQRWGRTIATWLSAIRALGEERRTGESADWRIVRLINNEDHLIVHRATQGLRLRPLSSSSGEMVSPDVRNLQPYSTGIKAADA